MTALLVADRQHTERLETKGWLQRHGSPADQRSKFLRLTEAGEHLLQQVEPRVRRAQRRLLKPLSRADRSIFLRCSGN